MEEQHEKVLGRARETSDMMVAKEPEFAHKASWRIRQVWYVMVSTSRTSADRAPASLPLYPRLEARLVRSRARDGLE